MKKFIFLVLILATLMACSIEPEPIDYGTDTGHYCRMTIVDQQHASEIVTKKGRVYKFDAIECMLNYLKTIDQSEIALFLINDYDDPGELIDAKSATYLISEGIQSPMGANLSGFSSAEAARSARQEHGGEVYSWQELINHFKDTEGVIK